MNKKLLSILCVCALMFAITMPSQAATGYQGYAVYRDGVIGNGSISFAWHAAMMDKASKDDIYPIIHASKGINVQYASWSEFKDGEAFMGYYRPTTSITSSKRDTVAATARALAANFIGYNFYYQMNYDVNNNPTGKTTVAVADITSMRCDGVVEYCYEFNNVPVFTPVDGWNISVWNENIRNAHANIRITPEQQAANYMTLIAANE